MKAFLKFKTSQVPTFLFCILLLFMQMQIPSHWVVACIMSIIIVEIIAIIQNHSFKKRKTLLMAGIILLFETIIMKLQAKGDNVEVQMEFASLILLSAFIIIVSSSISIDIHLIVLFLFWSSVIFSLLGILQYFFQFDVPFFKPVFIDRTLTRRLQCGFDGPNELANANAIIIGFVMLYHFLKHEVRLIYLGIIPLIFAIVLSWSRGGYLAIVFDVVVIIITALLKNKERNGNNLVRNIILVILTAIIAVILIYVYLPALESSRGGDVGRDGMLTYTFEVFKTAPVFGHGLGYTSFSTLIRQDTPHNEFFLFLVNGGLVGELGLLFLFFTILRAAWNKKQYEVFFGLLVFCFTELTFNNLVRYKVAMLFYMFLLLVESSVSNVDLKSNENRESINV